MELFTVQLARWREANQRGIEVVNTTVKSGMPIFAPSKDIVYGVKYHGMSTDEYRHEYLRLMNQSYFQNQQAWEEFLLFRRDSRIALACYCTPGEFCHRHLLAPMIQKVATHYQIPTVFYGEL